VEPRPAEAHVVTSATIAPPARTARSAARPAALLLSVALSALILTGCLPSNSQSFIDRTNSLRASHGIHALRNHGALDAKAQAWAEETARRGSLVHSNLSDGLHTVAWRTIGENLASGSDSGDWTAQLHNALVASPGHYANLVDRRFTHMGVGVAHARGMVYVVEVFVQI
jgi:uncharacterized protein YkwD